MVFTNSVPASSSAGAILFSSSSILTLLSTRTSPGLRALMAFCASSPMTSLVYLTSCSKYICSTLACISNPVKSYLPGLLWWAPSTTFASLRSLMVGTTAWILEASRILLLAGSRGMLMSARRKTVLPATSTSSRVRKS